jgi:hypothetical protein
MIPQSLTKLKLQTWNALLTIKRRMNDPQRRKSLFRNVIYIISAIALTFTLFQLIRKIIPTDNSITPIVKSAEESTQKNVMTSDQRLAPPRMVSPGTQQPVEIVAPTKKIIGRTLTPPNLNSSEKRELQTRLDVGNQQMSEMFREQNENR